MFRNLFTAFLIPAAVSVVSVKGKRQRRPILRGVEIGRRVQQDQPLQVSRKIVTFGDQETIYADEIDETISKLAFVLKLETNFAIDQF